MERKDKKELRLTFTMSEYNQLKEVKDYLGLEWKELFLFLAEKYKAEKNNFKEVRRWERASTI